MTTFFMDSNAFISSARLHYCFNKKIFHPFWRVLENLIKSHTILLLDVVYKELVPAGSDDTRDTLSDWVEATCHDCQISHKTDAIGAAYVEVQDHLSASGLYRSQAIALWAEESKADPWLIAAAKVHDAVIITDEAPSHPTQQQPQKKEPKIPDVAHALGVQTCTLPEFIQKSNKFVEANYPIQRLLKWSWCDYVQGWLPIDIGSHSI